MIAIGSFNTIHPSVVIGNSGFSFTKDKFRKPLTSDMGVLIGDGNYIAAFCNIDEGIYETTSIGDNNIIDSRVHISHDVEIGNHCEIDTGSALLGHVKIGNNVRICTGAIVHPFVKIHDGAVLGANSYLRHDLEADKIAYGSPAVVKHNTKYGKYLEGLKNE